MSTVRDPENLILHLVDIVGTCMEWSSFDLTHASKWD